MLRHSSGHKVFSVAFFSTFLMVSLDKQIWFFDEVQFINSFSFKFSPFCHFNDAFSKPYVIKVCLLLDTTLWFLELITSN